MRSFQVLDRNQQIYQDTLLEASAGTGKTFSIENIVVRLLIGEVPVVLEQILIVTFTRAATRDLKVRIHNNIVKAIQLLKQGVSNVNDHKEIPDYLLSIIEGGKECALAAIRKLEQALFSFDLSEIHTIHKFCLKTLSENPLTANFSLSKNDDEGIFGKQMIKMALRDYFRGGNLQKIFSKGQIDLLMMGFSGSTESLEKEIVKIIEKNIEIAPQPTLEEELEAFRKTMQYLKSNFGFTREQIVDDFEKLARNYNKVVGTNGAYKENYLERVKAFARLFDNVSWDVQDFDFLIEIKLAVSQALNPENKTKKGFKEDPTVKCPEMGQVFEKHLAVFLSKNRLLARLACLFQKALTRKKENEETFSHDDFLLSMKKALANPDFKASVSKKYKAAIIDEFQDTDPLQWEIFQELFLSDDRNGCNLYIVGDPKQSIYSFRQADIYTYLKAAERIPPSSQYSLDTNYRSHSPLVDALNAIFCRSSCPGLFPLPKLESEMEYPEVLPSQRTEEIKFSDGKGALHFCIAEDPNSSRYPLNRLEIEYFFPFIAEEILRLREKHHFSFSSFCILISDHYQGKKVSEFLKNLGIPVVTQKAANLADSPAVLAMKELLLAVQNPKDLSLLKIALGGKLIRWTQEEVRALDDPINLESVLYKFFALRTELFNSGFHSFMNLLFKTCWKDDEVTFFERFLIEEASEEFLHEVMQLSDFALEYENTHISSFSSLIQCFDELTSNTESDEDQIKVNSDPSKNAVQLITTFSSKGLEYDIVFPLALLKRKSPEEKLFPVDREEKRCLVPYDLSDTDAFNAFCEERDAEKMRQLYVAMTRAKYRLYLPAIFAPKAVEKKFGGASAMELFLARLGQKQGCAQNVYDRLKGLDCGEFVDFLNNLKENHSITYSVYSGTPKPLNRIEIVDEAKIMPPPQVEIPGKPIFLHSFSSLSSTLGKERSSPLPAPRDFKEENKTAHTLPSGTETGSLLHHILESINFEMFKDINSPSDITSTVHPFVTGTDYEPWNEVISEMLFHTLKVPLFDRFSLCDLSSKKCIREGEFLYKSHLQGAQGFLKGFIDLFFEHEGKVYLIDWKSNWLGPDSTCYAEEYLHASMIENDYLLQARLYKLAVEKYWGLFEKRPFDELFGGVCYLFLRGINSFEMGTHGIYYLDTKDF